MSTTRTHFSDTADADARIYAVVESQATAATAAATAADPQSWLFAQRTRFLNDGSCDPWAEQMLYRAGLLPTR